MKNWMNIECNERFYSIQRRGKNILDSKLYRSYTIAMKAATSLPDRLYKAAEDITATLNRVYSDEAPIQETSQKETHDLQVEALRELTKNDTW